MKNRNLIESIVCAARGMWQGFKSEKNFKVYTVIGLLFLILNIILSSKPYDYVILVMAAAAVFSTEYVNTAIERVVDSFGEGIHEDFKFIKDVAAGAVLVSGIAFFVAEGIILLPKIFG